MMISVTIEEIRSHLRDTYNFGPEQLETMLASLTNSLKHEFVNVESALAQHDLIALAKASHSIKGALLNAGINDWSELARKIELSAKNADSLDYKGLVDELKNGVNAVL